MVTGNEELLLSSATHLDFVHGMTWCALFSSLSQTLFIIIISLQKKSTVIMFTIANYCSKKA